MFPGCPSLLCHIQYGWRDGEHSQSDRLTREADVPEERLQEGTVVDRLLIRRDLFFQQLLELCEVVLRRGAHVIDTRHMVTDHG